MSDIRIEVDGYEELMRYMKRLGISVRSTIRMSVNDTAKQMRGKLHEEVNGRYVLKKTKFYKRGMTLTYASNNTLTATLHAKGNPLPIKDFETRRNGKITAAKGHQLRSTSLSELIIDGRKAFQQTITMKKDDGTETKSTNIFYRESDKRFPIKKVYGSSVPSMFGNVNVYDKKIEPMAQSLLQKNLSRHIELALSRR